MIKSYIAKRIRRFERRFFPTLRYNKTYRLVSGILLVPVALVAYALDKVLSIKKRKSKPRNKINLKNIVDGFSNLAFPDPEVEKMAIARAEICAGCPFAVKTGVYSMIVDKRTKQIQGMKCDKCGCNLSAKVRSANDTCPLGKW